MEVEHIKGLIDENRLPPETVQNLIIAIIKNDRKLSLTRRCFETPENPNGFIKTTDIRRLFREKEASAIIQKLTSPQQSSTSLFSFLPTSKRPSNSSQSSAGASREETKGYLPDNKARFRELFWGNSVKKGEIVPQDEAQQDDLEVCTIQEVLETLNKRAIEQPSENNKFTELADEALLLMEWLYRYRDNLYLDGTEVEAISAILQQIPETERPTRYPEEDKAHFFILDRQGKPGIFFGEGNFETKMATDGKRIAARLLLRFSDDKTHLSQENDIPFKTSKNFILSSTSLNFVSNMLHQILVRIFIQKQKDQTEEDQTEKEREHGHQKSWQVSPEFWTRSDAIIRDWTERAEKIRENTRKRKLRIAAINQNITELQSKNTVLEEGNRELHQKSLSLIQQKIESDNSKSNFEETIRLMNKKTSVDIYHIEPIFIKEIIDENRLPPETVQNLIIAIINNDSRHDRKAFALTHRCLETLENPNGFITKEKIESLVTQGKLSKKVLEKLGFVSPQLSNGSLFTNLSFLPASKRPSNSSQSSAGASREETKGYLLEERRKDSHSVRLSVGADDLVASKDICVEDLEVGTIQEVLETLNKRAIEQPSENHKFTELADEALLLMEWLYRYRDNLYLDGTEVEAIFAILQQIPETERPTRYPEEDKAHFFILDQPRKPGIFFEDRNFETKMATDGKKIATRLLLRFSDDKTHLSQENDILFKTSKNFILSGTSLNLVSNMLHQILVRIFIQKQKDQTEEDQTEKEREHGHQKSWQVSPEFWTRSDAIIRDWTERAEKIRENTRRRKLHIAQMDKESKERQTRLARLKIQNNADRLSDLTFTQETIESDDRESNFENTIRLMNKKTSVGIYYIETAFIKTLLDERRLDSESDTFKNLIIAIINDDSRNDRNAFALTRRCLETLENPNGFITKEKIESLVTQGKLSKKVLEKLGFVSPQLSNGSLFTNLSFLPASKRPSNSSQSSAGASREETKSDEEEGLGKKKAAGTVQQTLTLA